SDVCSSDLKHKDDWSVYPPASGRETLAQTLPPASANAFKANTELDDVIGAIPAPAHGASSGGSDGRSASGSNGLLATDARQGVPRSGQPATLTRQKQLLPSG